MLSTTWTAARSAKRAWRSASRRTTSTTPSSTRCRRGGRWGASRGSSFRWSASTRAGGSAAAARGERTRGSSWRAPTTRAPDALFSDLKRLLIVVHVLPARRREYRGLEPRAPGSRGALWSSVAPRCATRRGSRPAPRRCRAPPPHAARRGARSLHNEEASPPCSAARGTGCTSKRSPSPTRCTLSRARDLIPARAGPWLHAVSDFGRWRPGGTVVEFTLPHTATTWRSRLMYGKWRRRSARVRFDSEAIGPAALPARGAACPLVVRLKEEGAAIRGHDEQGPLEPVGATKGRSVCVAAAGSTAKRPIQALLVRSPARRRHAHTPQRKTHPKKVSKKNEQPHGGLHGLRASRVLLGTTRSAIQSEPDPT